MICLPSLMVGSGRESAATVEAAPGGRVRTMPAWIRLGFASEFRLISSAVVTPKREAMADR